MFRLATATVLLLATILPVDAYQQFEEYRISGNEIRSVKLLPQEVEAPGTIVIELTTDTAEARQITIESDFDIEPCKARIEEIIGNAQAYIQIVVHMTAQTMNGVVVTQCATLYGLSDSTQ